MQNRCLFVVVVLVVLTCLSINAFAAISAQERAALISLYNSTNGENWRNNNGWKKLPVDETGFAMPGTEATWYGVTCDLGNTAVESIDLRGNILDGSIPPELGDLTNLQHLVLYGNQLTGNIPPELGGLAILHELDLKQNKLTGDIPPELGNLLNLQDLDLDANQLTGSIPPELGNLTNLWFLRLQNNQLSGSIPPELGNLANLKSLNLSTNQLSGPLPDELLNMTRLRSCDLCRNYLFTESDNLRDFFNTKQEGGDWESCQYHYTVTASAGEHGTIDPVNTIGAFHGERLIFTLMADEGYELFTVAGCNGKLEGNVYSTGEITGPCEVTATFKVVFSWPMLLPAIVPRQQSR